MFPDSSGPKTPPTPIAPRPQNNEDVDGDLDGRRPPALSGAESAPVKSPEPHWDQVIGAATD
jgi:hypothetical protein